MKLIFFNLDKGGKLVEVNPEKKSLHHRRSIIIQDNKNSCLWIHNGKNVVKEKTKLARTHAKELNAQLGFKFNIYEIKKRETVDLIPKILDRENLSSMFPESTKSKKPSKKKVIKKGKIPVPPPTPKINSLSPLLVGDRKEEGSLMEDFEITYYDSDDGEKTGTYTVLLVDFFTEIQYLKNSLKSKDEVARKLKEIVDKILVLF
jgi:hypothetical protein